MMRFYCNQFHFVLKARNVPMENFVFLGVLDVLVVGF